MNVENIDLRKQLQEKDEELRGKDDLFGMTLLTNPALISASRNIMFTSHLRQIVNLKNPQIPKVFTNYENIVGQMSTSYKEMKGDREIYAIVNKYGDNRNAGYTMFLYDKENDKYTVIERKKVEDLTEKYGYEYNTDKMDSLDEGDIIEKGEVLYKSYSYDEDMNYRYGVNAKFMYQLDTRTIEDAIVVSESLSKRMVSKEVETFNVPLNDNDIFLNIYGDSSEYKGFPEVGEFVQGSIVCSKRRIHNSQILHDLKDDNLRKIEFSRDVSSYCPGMIQDVFVYCNKPLDDVPDTQFNLQLKKYLQWQKEFFEKVLEITDDIIASGSSYSEDINRYNKKARDYLNDNIQWREENKKVFSNMIIKFTVTRDIPLTVGQKITGRYGNKGVISKIVPDDEMPILETGEHVEIIFNTLGVINRLNSQQLFEQSMTFIGNRLVERFREGDLPVKEKKRLLLKCLSYFNEKESSKLSEYMDLLDKKGLDEFFSDLDETGLFIHIPPMWEDRPLYDRIQDLYDDEDFKFIKPYKVYVNKWGRKIQMLKDLVVGDMYVIKLRQTSRKGFSARSTGSINKKGLPEKPTKTNNELYSKTPIRIGIQENTNAVIGVDPKVIAKLHLFYRNSMEARQELGSRLAEDGHITSLDPRGYVNRNVEIFNAFMKTMGLKLVFEDENDFVSVDVGDLESTEFNNRLIIATQDDTKKSVARFKAEEEFNSEKETFVGTQEAYEARITTKVLNILDEEANIEILEE